MPSIDHHFASILLDFVCASSVMGQNWLMIAARWLRILIKRTTRVNRNWPLKSSTLHTRQCNPSSQTNLITICIFVFARFSPLAISFLMFKSFFRFCPAQRILMVKPERLVFTVFELKSVVIGKRESRFLKKWFWVWAHYSSLMIVSWQLYYWRFRTHSDCNARTD